MNCQKLQDKLFAVFVKHHSEISTGVPRARKVLQAACGLHISLENKGLLQHYDGETVSVITFNKCMYVEGVGQKSGPCTGTFNDLLCFLTSVFDFN
jgi:hypothetical protein